MTKIIENKLSSDDEQKFDEILQLLLESEIYNSVGTTNRGSLKNLTINFEYEKQQKDVFQLTIPEVRVYYRTIYQNNQCHYIQDLELAYTYFDSVVQLQSKDAIDILQSAIGNGLQQDGKMGKTTLIKVNEISPKQLAQKLIQQRRDFQTKLIKAEPSLRFIEEFWNGRLDEINDIISNEVLSKRLQKKKSKLISSSNLGQQICDQENQEEKQLESFNFQLDISNLNRIKGVDCKNGRFLVDEQENIFLSDLITVLSVYMDDSIKPEHKNISFSLDPILQPNSNELTQQEKVCWPDKFVNRKVIQDSELVRVMFESDYLMKLMSLGVEQDGKKPFEYPKQLTELGLKSCGDFENASEKRINEPMFCRFWLVPEKCTYSYLNGQYLLEDVQVTCQTRQMEIIKDNLQDKIVQDENDSSYKFAQKFTQLYDQIASHYPIFNRLKQVFKAVALGKWMYENNFKVDIKQMMVYNRKANNNPKIIPMVKGERQVAETPLYYTRAEKIEKVKEYLREKSLPFVKEIINDLVYEIPDLKGYKVQNQYFEGGIDPNSRKMEKISWPRQKQNLAEQTFDQVEIPFLPFQKCKDCPRKIENQLLNFKKDKCSLHNDQTCFSCLELVLSNDQNPKMQTITNQKYFFHNQCYYDYQRKDQLTGQENFYKQQGLAFKEQQKYDNNKFEVILNNVLVNEGGKSNDKNDRGGKTNWGITQKNYDEDQKERNLPTKNVNLLSNKERNDYYQWKYKTFKVDKISDPNLSYSFFDYAVHSGYNRAAKTLQVIIGVKADGIIGKDTLKQLSTVDQKKVAFQLLEKREQFLNNFCDQNPDQECFRKGFENRIKRIKNQITKGIVIREDSNNNFNQQQKQGKSEGGIDCALEIIQLNNIMGVNTKNTKFLIDSEENINFSDLITVLSVFLDPDIPEQEKQISFSLDPIILSDDQEFYHQEKVCWPDKLMNRNIIQDTELAQVMFESDFLLKQISLGLREDGITPFAYPKQLALLGLKPYFEFEKEQPPQRQQRIFRFLLAPYECTYQNKNESYVIDDIKVMCKSQSMERIGNTLQDKSQQNSDDCATQFAAKFTEIYDIIAQNYPIFNRLKSLFKAVALGKWITLNYLKIDYHQLQPFVKKINNNPKIISVIKAKHQGESFRTPIYFTAEEKYKQEFPLTADNIHQSLLNFSDLKGYLYQRSIYYAHGGVDTNCQFFKKQSSPFIKNEETIFQEIQIPFISLQYSENSRNVEKYLMNIDSTKCSIHHKQTCNNCLDITNHQKDIKCNIISEKQCIHEFFEQIQKYRKKE